jgi:hypothetical protein
MAYKYLLGFALVQNLERINGVHLPAQTLVPVLSQGMREGKRQEQELQLMQAKIYTLPVRIQLVSVTRRTMIFNV